MKIIEVIPLKKGIRLENLTYFTSLPVKLGDIVEISLRSKKSKGIVINVSLLENLKSEVKSSDFALKKVERIISGSEILSKPLLRTVERTAEYFIGSEGTILSTLLNDSSIGLLEKISKDILKVSKKNHSKIAIQGDDEERLGSYKSIIRQAFAKKESIFVIVPTILDGESIKQRLEKGIEEYTILLHSKISKKYQTEIENKLSDLSHPILIISTPAFVGVFRKDITHIIIERVNSKNYKIQTRPYFDWRKFIESFAEEIGLPIMFGDITLPIDIESGVYDGEINKGEPMRSRVFSNSLAEVIDMSNKKTEILSQELIELIKEGKENHEHTILFTGRKGLFPQTICSDCGTAVICEKCKAPLVLYPNPEDKDSFFYMCNHCGERYSSFIKCKTCTSWKLTTLGIGTDLVEKKVKEYFPDIKILRIDGDKTPKEKDAKKVITEMEKSPGSILIATEMALRFIKDKVENTAVVSFDSLASIPDFRVNERLFYLLSTIRTKTTRKMLVQTRNIDNDAIKYFPNGNILEFSRSELASRQETDFPPYSILIKITIKGKKDFVIKEMKNIQETLHPIETDVFPSFTYNEKGEYILHAVSKIQNKKWPDQEMIKKLKSLPPWIEIRVDPESLL